MASTFTPEDGAKYWEHRYEIGETGWHRTSVHSLLIKHYSKLNPNDTVRKVLVTMCGMSVDMNWLADKGLEVVGVDISLQALRNFVAESGQDWTESSAPKLGTDAKLFTRKDGKIKLYCGDVLNISPELEGNFDAIYDCDGLHVIDRASTSKYSEMIKNILNPGGRLLLEAIAYDPKILEDENFKPDMPVPPPYSMAVAETKNLFEPECTVDIVDKHVNTLLYGKEAEFYTYVIVKK